MESLHSERGYTLIEMLGVVILAVVLFATGASYLGSRSRILDAAATQVAASLRLARNRAILNGRPTGVQFRPDLGLYGIFEDIGLDGKGPGDAGYVAPDADGTEGNNFWDHDPSKGRAEPVSDVKESLVEGILFGVLATVDPEGNALRSPIPAPTRALVFDTRGRLTETTPGWNYVYLINAQKTEMRALRVDPWHGYVQIFKWDWDAEEWHYR